MTNSKTRNIRLATLLGALALAGCATTPKENPDVIDARQAVEKATLDPVVSSNAPVALKEAEESLAETETLWQSKAAPADIRHQAYMTVQKAKIAEQKARLNAAEKEVAQAQREQQGVLLQARENQTKKLELQIRELQAEQTSRGLVLTLGDVLFDVGKADLQPGGLRVVDKLTVFLFENPKRTIRIEGHTDSTGSLEFNRVLSEQRANAVRNALVDRGISHSRINTVGYGPQYPVATNATAAGRQQNRRVEVVISDETGRIGARN